MLYYTTSKGEFNWHVGKRLPNEDKVTDLQADGDELEMIRGMFPSLTPNKVSVANWSGEIANLLFTNLRNAI